MDRPTAQTRYDAIRTELVALTLVGTDRMGTAQDPRVPALIAEADRLRPLLRGPMVMETRVRRHRSR